ncbi:GNAT family N-acetyltransferase [Ruminococcus sp. CLA-AA-H200]|uniref:GNAT family N-acetyltransferase n=2 Tax=Ruminococcus turbiniformis TaxID=2881258 RepID=A0ABS8G200_9FIRM|nr:GNAT family N-acetyltransferase [Ruminococcus turbiniformis]
MLLIRECPELAEQAAEWFHGNWNIPAAEYMGSIKECLKNEKAVPQWYVVKAGKRIIGGAGVIENDFHDRKDLAPNLCALYVEKEFRRRGVAGQLLRCVCRDMKEKGVDMLYLITEHTSFYERYGWEFLCMVHGDDGEEMRMYRKETENAV